MWERFTWQRGKLDSRTKHLLLAAQLCVVSCNRTLMVLLLLSSPIATHVVSLSSKIYLEKEKLIVILTESDKVNITQ